jgi:hypothetical protein
MAMENGTMDSVTVESSSKGGSIFFFLAWPFPSRHLLLYFFLEQMQLEPWNINAEGRRERSKAVHHCFDTRPLQHLLSRATAAATKKEMKKAR